MREKCSGYGSGGTKANVCVPAVFGNRQCRMERCQWNIESQDAMEGRLG